MLCGLSVVESFVDVDIRANWPTANTGWLHVYLDVTGFVDFNLFGVWNIEAQWPTSVLEQRHRDFYKLNVLFSNTK